MPEAAAPDAPAPAAEAKAKAKAKASPAPDAGSPAAAASTVGVPPAGGPAAEPAPGDIKEWASAAQAKIADAKSITAGLLAHLSVADPHVERVVFTGAVSKTPKEMRNCDELTEKSRECLDCLEDIFKETGELLYRLTHARHAKAASLQVCEWRLRLREKRPKQELFSDHLQQALEAEGAALTQCRTELVARAKEAKEVLKKLDITKGKLWKDSTVNRHLQPNKEKAPRMLPPPSPKSAALAGQSPPTPTSPTSPKSVDLSASMSSTKIKVDPLVLELSKMDLKALMEFAYKVEGQAIKVCRQGNESLTSTTSRSLSANDTVCKSLTRRCKETEALRHQLEEQLTEVGAAIEMAEGSASRMKRKIDISATGKAPMEPGLQAKYETTVDMLVKLRPAHKQIEEDLRCKVVSFKIDDACRKVTPEKASQSPRSSSAAKAVLAHLGGPKKSAVRGGGMERTMSSPGLLNTSASALNTSAMDISDPGSPVAGRAATPPGAGGSKALKGAAGAVLAPKASSDKLPALDAKAGSAKAAA